LRKKRIHCSAVKGRALFVGRLLRSGEEIRFQIGGKRESENLSTRRKKKEVQTTVRKAKSRKTSPPEILALRDIPTGAALWI